MLMSSADVSVVVQGPICRRSGSDLSQSVTLQCLNSIRQFLPKAEIILSTWEGSDVTGLDYDKLVLSKDPLQEGEISENQPNNVNRIIVSTLSGVKAASREYVLKLRSDFALKNNNIIKGYLDWCEQKTSLDKQYKVFKERVLVSSFFTTNTQVVPFPYHVSDWFYFGCRDDLLNLFDIPLFKSNEAAVLAKKKTIQSIGKPFIFNAFFTPEQYIWITFLKKYFDIKVTYHADLAVDNNRHLFCLVANLVVMEPTRVGIWAGRFNKQIKHPLIKAVHITYSDFCVLSKQLGSLNKGVNVKQYAYYYCLQFMRFFLKKTTAMSRWWS